MGHALFRAADIPHRLMPAATALGTSTFTMSAMPGTPAIQNAIPMPFGTTRSPHRPRVIASAIMLGFGLWWLRLAESRARRRGDATPMPGLPRRRLRRKAACCASAPRSPREYDPSEIAHGAHAAAPPPIAIAASPLVTVVAVNLVMSFAVLPHIDAGFLAEPRWGATSLAAVGGVWSVIVALAAATVLLVAINGA